jgi:hypothetical protein
MIRFSFLVATLAVTGCGSGVGSVTGKVTYGGQPLPSGTVIFHAPDGRTGHSAIGQDGSYEIRDVPVGTVRVSVQSHSRIPDGLSKAAMRDPDFKAPKTLPQGLRLVNIPQRYGNPSRSGLRYAVISGRQTYDITLEP